MHMKNCYRISVVLFLGMALPASADETSVSQNKTHSTATSHDDFYLSVLVDFIDDALEIHYTPEKIEQMMTIFKQIGIRRVYWQ